MDERERERVLDDAIDATRRLFSTRWKWNRDEGTPEEGRRRGDLIQLNTIIVIARRRVVLQRNYR